MKDLNAMTVKELKAYIKQFGKVANTRLRNIEKGGYTRSSSAYRYVEMKVQSTLGTAPNPTIQARLDLARRTYGFTESRQIKFQTNVSGQTRGSLLHRARQIERFLDAETSTVSGTKHLLAERAAALLEAQRETQNVTENTNFFYLLHDDMYFENFIEAYGSGGVNELEQRTFGWSMDKVKQFIRENYPYWDEASQRVLKPLDEVLNATEEFYQRFVAQNAGDANIRNGGFY